MEPWTQTFGYHFVPFLETLFPSFRREYTRKEDSECHFRIKVCCVHSAWKQWKIVSIFMRAGLPRLTPSPLQSEGMHLPGWVLLSESHWTTQQPFLLASPQISLERITVENLSVCSFSATYSASSNLSLMTHKWEIVNHSPGSVSLVGFMYWQAALGRDVM